MTNPFVARTLSFYVATAESQIERGIFNKHMNREHIQKTLKRRADEYDKQMNLRFSKGLKRTIDKLDIEISSWEQIISTIREYDPAFHDQKKNYLIFVFSSIAQAKITFHR